jgi:hypothetical protein
MPLKSTHIDSKLTTTLCPYCAKPLRWIAMRWLARGVFECDRCGEFPDFRHPVRERAPVKAWATAENAEIAENNQSLRAPRAPRLIV